MVSIKTLRTLALQFDEATEAPHFEKTSFRVQQKIFATLDEAGKKLVVKLPELDQSVFCAFDTSIVYPVPNKWGKQGWTIVELAKVKKEFVRDMLTTAYCAVAPKRLVRKYTPTL